MTADVINWQNSKDTHHAASADYLCLTCVDYCQCCPMLMEPTDADSPVWTTASAVQCWWNQQMLTHLCGLLPVLSNADGTNRCWLTCVDYCQCCPMLMEPTDADSPVWTTANAVQCWWNQQMLTHLCGLLPMLYNADGTNRCWLTCVDYCQCCPMLMEPTDADSPVWTTASAVQCWWNQQMLTHLCGLLPMLYNADGTNRCWLTCVDYCQCCTMLMEPTDADSPVWTTANAVQCWWNQQMLTHLCGLLPMLYNADGTNRCWLTCVDYCQCCPMLMEPTDADSPVWTTASAVQCWWNQQMLTHLCGLLPVLSNADGTNRCWLTCVDYCQCCTMLMEPTDADSPVWTTANAVQCWWNQQMLTHLCGLLPVLSNADGTNRCWLTCVDYCQCCPMLMEPTDADSPVWTTANAVQCWWNQQMLTHLCGLLPMLYNADGTNRCWLTCVDYCQCCPMLMEPTDADSPVWTTANAVQCWWNQQMLTHLCGLLPMLSNADGTNRCWLTCVDYCQCCPMLMEPTDADSPVWTTASAVQCWWNQQMLTHLCGLLPVLSNADGTNRCWLTCVDYCQCCTMLMEPTDADSPVWTTASAVQCWWNQQMLTHLCGLLPVLSNADGTNRCWLTCVDSPVPLETLTRGEGVTTHLAGEVNKSLVLLSMAL